MNIFNLISLFGGLAMFLYGMRMMGDGLKASSSGTLKKAMEQLTNSRFKAFLLGMVMTAIIQSSTATIVITSGLVGAGILPLSRSLGIIIGANVGTTVTGQIIRLLDLNASGTSFLQFFKPSTLAPLALIIGIIIIMGGKNIKGKDTLGQVIIGFGILFSGLMNMTDAVSSLTETGIIESLFANLGENPIIGYVIGAGVAFVLQSSSASIGILQAFSTSGRLTFGAIYAVLLGIYLGDCVTTAIVINIGAKPDPKRVGYINIMYNLGKTALIWIAITLVHKIGLIDGMWNRTIYSGGIANANTVFNLACALILLPVMGLFEKLSYKLVKDEKVVTDEYDDMLTALNPVFFSTPAMALGRCYELLLVMFNMSKKNIERAFGMLTEYSEEMMEKISIDEDRIDKMADSISNYLVKMAAHISYEEHTEIMNNYYSAVTEFERLGDHAKNIAEHAQAMKDDETVFTTKAKVELDVLHQLLNQILDYTDLAFRNRDLDSAKHIEPLEEVVDDMVSAMKYNHLERLNEGQCSVAAGTEFLNILSEAERISDVCSNIGVATVVRVQPELKHQVHDYVSMLHAGQDDEFNNEYHSAHDKYFEMIQ